MGGLSLLLMAGEQQSSIDQRVVSTITGNYRTNDVINHLPGHSDIEQHVGVVKTDVVNKTVVDGVNEMSAIKTCLDSNVQPPVSDQDKLFVEETLKITRDVEVIIVYIECRASKCYLRVYQINRTFSVKK